MTRPNMTRRLSLTAAICSGAAMLLQCMTAVFSAPLLRMTVSYEYVLPAKWMLLLISTVLLYVPFLALAILGANRRELSRTFAWGTAAGGACLYLLGSVGGALMRSACVTLIGQMEGMAELSTASMTASYMGLFSVLYVAAVVALCCAGAVELYITKYHDQTPSDGEKEELS